MLVLGRKDGESIVIGDRIKITVKEIRGNRVHLGVDAPKWIRVDREEVWVKMESAKEVQNEPAA